MNDPPETVNPVLAALTRFLHPSAVNLPPHDALVWAMFAQSAIPVAAECTIEDGGPDAAASIADQLLEQYRARLKEGKFNG